MLYKRLMAAVPIFALFYGILWMDIFHARGWGLTAMLAFFCTWGLREFYRFARHLGWKPFSLFGYVLCVLFFFGHEQWCMEKWHGAEHVLPQGIDILTLLSAVAVGGSFVGQIFRKEQKGAMGNVATTLLGIAYCFYLISFIARMRHLGIARDGLPERWVYDGAEFVFLFVSIAKAADVGGLLIGSLIGKHKLCPHLSPKKTWEGAVGGMCTSVGLLSVFCLLAPNGTVASLGWSKIVLLGVLLSVTSLIGDLVESALKRDSAVKDAGTSVPGFGGILDMLDSLMISGPMMYYYLILVCGARPGA